METDERIGLHKGAATGDLSRPCESCVANFNARGPNRGITIVGGHEMAETITDQFPDGGCLDSGGSANGD
jgi:hypothetical protein